MRFDPSRGCAFSTYAWPSIIHHVWRAVEVYSRGERTKHAVGCSEWYTMFGVPSVYSRGERTKHAVGCSEWQRIASVDPAALDAVWSVHDTLHALVARLSERLQCIIVARYGLDGRGGRLYREIGQHLGVSAERVHQLHTEALVWLRHPAHSQHLPSLLAYHTLANYEWAEAEAQR
jgi:RNA polymerase sigma factor (sigma-70 family)